MLGGYADSDVLVRGAYLELPACQGSDDNDDDDVSICSLMSDQYTSW